MVCLVMKFGGTSVANIERIRNVARHVKREVDAGNQCAVVVSAMAGATNQLVAWTREASPLHDAREYDTVVASGEQVTAGLLAIVLQAMGVQARSWLGWQIPIKTDKAHGAARIADIHADEIKARLARGEVAVIAGFQGIGPDNRITTLGRGGSDTSAVAVAAALKADRCDIYTDVDGVYTTDPRIVPKAQRLDRISYEEMLEMGIARRQGAADPLGRTRHGAWRARAGPLQLRSAGRRAHPPPTAISPAPVPLFAMRMKSWNSVWSAASPMPRMRRKSPSSGLRTSRGLRRGCSARWPRRTSMSI
jgi:aspartate kinase (EC 2.7.2.4)